VPAPPHIITGMRGSARMVRRTFKMAFPSIWA
jgi:hypothetical protein